MSDKPSERQLEIARKLGYQGLFADRDTLDDAYKYAKSVADMTNYQTAVLTAVFVYGNTVTKLLSQIFESNEKVDMEIIAILENLKDGIENNYLNDDEAIKDIMTVIQSLEDKNE